MVQEHYSANTIQEAARANKPFDQSESESEGPGGRGTPPKVVRRSAPAVPTKNDPKGRLLSLARSVKTKDATATAFATAGGISFVRP